MGGVRPFGPFVPNPVEFHIFFFLSFFWFRFFLSFGFVSFFLLVSFLSFFWFRFFLSFRFVSFFLSFFVFLSFFHSFFFFLNSLLKSAQPVFEAGSRLRDFLLTKMVN